MRILGAGHGDVGGGQMANGAGDGPVSSGAADDPRAGALCKGDGMAFGGAFSMFVRSPSSGENAHHLRRALWDGSRVQGVVGGV